MEAVEDVVEVRLEAAEVEVMVVEDRQLERGETATDTPPTKNCLSYWEYVGVYQLKKTVENTT